MRLTREDFRLADRHEADTAAYERQLVRVRAVERQRAEAIAKHEREVEAAEVELAYTLRRLWRADRARFLRSESLRESVRAGSARGPRTKALKAIVSEVLSAMEGETL